MLRIASVALILATAAHALQLHSADNQKVPVWVWWNFPAGTSTTFRLNVRTWLAHMPEHKFELRLVNDSNIKEFFPDMPEEFFMLYPEAKSDFLRGTMLALHGGVYMDGDMVLNQDLDEVFKDLYSGEADLMPYLFGGATCPMPVATNFMAGAKGNKLNRLWLEETVQLMRSRCDESTPIDFSGTGVPQAWDKSKICCYNPDGTKRKNGCYVDFGAIGDKMYEKVLRSGNVSDVRVRCISADQGMAVPRSGSNGELLWKRLLPGPPPGFNASKMQFPSVKWGDIPKTDRKLETCWRKDDDLECTASGLFPRFFKRTGAHQFNGINSNIMGGFETEEELLASETVAAEFYNTALAAESDSPDPRYAALDIKSAVVKYHARDAMWGGHFNLTNRTKKSLHLVKLPWLALGA